MTVKNFGFAARRKATQGKGAAKPKDIPFKLETTGPTYHVRGDLNGDGLAVISAMFVRAEGNKDHAQMSSGLFDTLEAVFTPDTVTGLLAKIKDSDDPFGFTELGEIIEWATEEHAGGRPTTSSRT